jgi:hypothetical protein
MQTGEDKEEEIPDCLVEEDRDEVDKYSGIAQ